MRTTFLWMTILISLLLLSGCASANNANIAEDKLLGSWKLIMVGEKAVENIDSIIVFNKNGRCIMKTIYVESGKKQEDKEYGNYYITGNRLFITVKNKAKMFEGGLKLTDSGLL